MTTAGSVSYAYDWLGRRVSRTVSGGTTTCVYDGQGNIVGLSNSGGALVEKYNYGVYGLVEILSPNNEPRTTSLFDNPYYFTGRELDNETGLYYYRARMYEPQLGRFMQTDPAGYINSMNLYTYCLNNPINFIDPLGLLVDEARKEYKDIIKTAQQYQKKYCYYIPIFWDCNDQNGGLQKLLKSRGYKYWEFPDAPTGEVYGKSRNGPSIWPGNHSVIRVQPSSRSKIAEKKAAEQQRGRTLSEKENRQIYENLRGERFTLDAFDNLWPGEAVGVGSWDSFDNEYPYEQPGLFEWLW